MIDSGTDALSSPVGAKSIGNEAPSGSTEQTDQKIVAEANHQSRVKEESGNDKKTKKNDKKTKKNDKRNKNNNNNDDGSYNLKLMGELQQTTKSLSADIKLIRKALEVGDQTTKIQFQLLRKELDESKAETEKRNRLLIAVCQQLKPDSDINTLSTLDEILAALLTTDKGGTKANHQLQEQQVMKNIEHSEIKRHMTEMERAFSGVMEEMEELKKRESRRAMVTFETEHEPTSKDEEEGGLKRSLTERIMTQEEEESEHHFLPSDTYSYFAVADYFNRGRYCMYPTKLFLLASFTLTIQLVTLSIFTFDVVDYRNLSNPLSVPPGVGTQVRVSQLIALLISCFNQDEVRASFNVLSLGYRKSKVRTIHCHATRFKWYFSFFTRIFLGWFSLIVTFILIINSETVRDVMLDFAAVTFVSELDNGAFQLSLWGYMGKDVQRLTSKIKNILIYEKIVVKSRRRLKAPRLAWLCLLIVCVIGFWAWITTKQQHGDYLDQSIFVQFGDDFSPAMGAFSGIYDMELDDTLDGMRVNYVEHGGKSSKSAGRFSYCSQDKRWLFQYGTQPEGYVEHWFSRCWHKARSAQTDSYDLTETSDISWFVLDEDMASLENPLQHFLVKSQNDYYGKSCKTNDECGDRKYCDDIDKTCVCEDGLFGLNCEFQTPCQTLEIDSRDENGFVGTRRWSRRYSSISQDETNNTNPIQVYGKPVYVGDESVEGMIDVMVFTGRRWILTDSASLEDYTANYNSSETLALPSLSEEEDSNEGGSMHAKRNLAEFLAENFHAYWSNYTFHFASEPVDVGTPTDSATPVGLQWFRLEIGTRGASLRSEQVWLGSTNIEANLICAVCHNETNPCFYGATCRADGTCDCTTGSSGIICQIPPVDNGNCDVFFNTPEFAFDGGDCCQETCTSTAGYSCGKALLENSAGLSAYGFIGYPYCEDPRFKFKLSGSKTLYEVVEERRVVRCGNAESTPGFYEISEDGILSGFEVDFCKSIAAAALGDPAAIEIVDTSWRDRFHDLDSGKFDVLISRTTHSAERDVFQSDAKMGFSFARIQELFDGLRFAGIPPYAACADTLDVESPECVDMRICAPGGTTLFDVVERLFPYSMMVEVDNLEASVRGLEAGLCNVITGETSDVNELSVRSKGFTGTSYELGISLHSKEPLAAVTREDDRVWSKFVSWVFEAVVQAEESGITQLTADSIGPTNVFGEKFKNMFQNAVAAAGNFGEIYQRNLEYIIPRGGLNTINTGSSGLIYSFPLGAINTVGEGPVVRGTIESIRHRGVLRCGIRKLPGFAMLDTDSGIWRGFEVDMCRGIAAALFNGSPNVNFIPLTSAERFSALADGTVDLINCATTHTLTREISEVTTGQGFDFTPPTFYDGMGFAGRPPYVGCAEIRVFDGTHFDCINTRICVPDGTTWLDTILGTLNIPAANVVVTASQDDTYYKFVSGECNVIAGESIQIMESTVREFGLGENEEYRVGPLKYSKEPLAIVSRSVDAQFSDFLRWIVFGLFYAEEQGITRDDYFDMPTNYLFGSALSNMWQHSVEAVGNYGEIYARNFESILERVGPNNLNDNNGPQLLAMPGVVMNQ